MTVEVVAQGRLQSAPDPVLYTQVNQLTTLMRKIEQQMNEAVANSKSWTNANTSVVCDDNGVSHVYLHGNKIAEVGDDYLQVLMAVGNPTPPNLASMHLSIASAMQ